VTLPSSGESGANLSLARIRLRTSRSRGFPRVCGLGRAARSTETRKVQQHRAEERKCLCRAIFQYRIVADAGAGSACECGCRTCGQIIGYYSFVSVTLNVAKSRPARREAFERDPGALIPSASSGSPPRGMLLGGSAGIDRGACIPPSAAAGRPHHRPASVSTAAPDRRVRPKNRGPDQCVPEHSRSSAPSRRHGCRVLSRCDGRGRRCRDRRGVLGERDGANGHAAERSDKSPPSESDCPVQHHCLR